MGVARPAPPTASVHCRISPRKQPEEPFMPGVMKSRRSCDRPPDGRRGFDRSLKHVGASSNTYLRGGGAGPVRSKATVVWRRSVRDLRPDPATPGSHRTSQSCADPTCTINLIREVVRAAHGAGMSAAPDGIGASTPGRPSLRRYAPPDSPSICVL